MNAPEYLRKMKMGLFATQTFERIQTDIENGVYGDKATASLVLGLVYNATLEAAACEIESDQATKANNSPSTK